MDETFIDGVTEDGTHVKVLGSYPTFRVLIDGVEVEIVGRPRLFRDGGTVSIETTRGFIQKPRRMGSDDRTPRFDGKPLRGAER